MTPLAQNWLPSLRHHPQVFRSPAGFGGRAQPVIEPPGPHVCRGEEPRGSLADNFLRHMPQDSLGAGVPGQDAADRIEHEDRIILHVVCHQGEAFFFFKSLLVELGVFHGGRGAAGQVFGEVEVGGTIAASRFGSHQRQCPQGAAAANQRHANAGLEAQTTQRFQVLGIPGHSRQDRIRDFRVQVRLPGAT